MLRRAHLGVILAAGVVAAGVVGCRQDMHDQNKLQPLEASQFWGDGRASRSPVEGTVARGKLHDDRHMFEGRSNETGELVDTFPSPVTRALLERGHERYDIFCAPCHARTGDGDGMIVRRGYKTPPSFHAPETVQKNVGHYFEVITKGFGIMPPYAAQIPAEDRWAIVAYVRALQLSRNARVDDVPPSERASLSAPPASPPEGGAK